MAYVTRDQVVAHVPPALLTDALDDDGDGREDEGLLDNIIAVASQEVDALVAARYAVPFADPAPSPIVRAAQVFVMAMIYKRRRVQEGENPFQKEANQWREILREIGSGKRQLDACQAVVLQAGAGGQPQVPGRVPVSGSPTTY